MKKTKLFLILAAVIFGMAFFNAARATDTPEPIMDSSQTTLVATVNIYNASVISQDKNNIKISFDLSNRQLVQPDLKYAVLLIRQDKTSQVLVDEKVYPEVIMLNENQTLHKEIDYLAPSYLNGVFQIGLVVQNQNGMTLATSNLISVMLAGDSQYVEIDPASCYLKVDGEINDKKYIPAQGVDIKPEEKLIAYCDVTNHTDQAVTLIPRFKTYWRSAFGQEVNTNQESQIAITLDKQEKKQTSFNLPKAQTPQAYDVTLELTNNPNQIISNKTTFHYVLRGLSATIQNLRLDEDYYQKGEMAKVSFLWSASADNFPDSRLGKTDNGQMFANITIKNAQNQICATLKKELNQTSQLADYSLPINMDCQNPQIAVNIQDDKGNILDKQDFSIESQNVPVAQAKASQPNNVLKYGIILVLILLIISVFIIVFKKRKGVSVIIFLILAGGIFLSSGVGAKADTFTIGSTNSYGYFNGWYANTNISYSPCRLDWSYLTMNPPYPAPAAVAAATAARANFDVCVALNGANSTNLYAPGVVTARTGGAVTARRTVSNTFCVNTPWTFSATTVKVVSASGSLITTVAVPAETVAGGGYGFRWSAGKEVTFTAPSTVGDYRVLFNDGSLGNYVLRVTAPPVNGGWSAWSACSAACGGGIQTRSCNNPFVSGGGADCAGANTQACNIQACVAVPNPTLILTATPNPITHGNTTTLTWTTANASSCWATGGEFGDTWRNTWKASSNGSHNFEIIPTVTSTYTIECWNSATPAVSTGQKSVPVTVNVVATPLSCNANTISSCVLPLTSSGSSAGTCSPSYSGSCNYTCTNGVWTENSNSCIASCTLPVCGAVSTICSGDVCNDCSGVPVNGTKNCSGWREVSPN